MTQTITRRTRRTRRTAALLAAALVALQSTPSPAASRPDPVAAETPAPPAPLGPLSSSERALHVLNRLGFGPRPGEVDLVSRMGVNAWIERQLRPENLSDSMLRARLSEFSTLEMSSRDLFESFEKPIREARRQRREQQAFKSTGEGKSQSMSAETAKADADAEEELRNRIPPEKRPRRIIEELSAARVLRAAYSERQLNEVLVDFWMNHFNVYAAKGLDRIFITSFERDVIRPRIWGRFEDLLLATAKSPAMLFYLDNAQSVADAEHRPAPPARRFARGGFGSPAEMAATGASVPKRRGGLNENYARELMELHTLGVDGGYTQKDVTELARVLTGWSIEPEQGEFLFRPRVHDSGTKTVLGQTLSSGGIDEGEQMIGFLARRPETAHHIALELCERFVSDQPPPALVDRVARKFLSSGGDLRETVRTVVESPEFFARESYRAKIKSPFEYVVSAIRAAGGETNARPALLKEIAQMGEPLYLCQPPTGYSDAGSAWVNTGALVARLNFAIALASNRLAGTAVDVPRLMAASNAPASGGPVDRLAKALIGDGPGLSAETRRTIEARLSGPDNDKGKVPGSDAPSENTQLSLIAGLILGSPEFQRQ